MKDTFLCFLGILGSNYIFSQDVSPCNYFEMIIPLNNPSSMTLNINYIGNEDDLITEDSIFLWSPGEELIAYFNDYNINDLDTNQSYNVCVDFNINLINCSICNQFVWSDNLWVIDNEISLVPNYVLDDENNDYYYDLSGVRYNSYGEIPSGYMYIHNRKKYIKE
jgi:hypothetical protein